MTAEVQERCPSRVQFTKQYSLSRMKFCDIGMELLQFFYQRTLDEAIKSEVHVAGWEWRIWKTFIDIEKNTYTVVLHMENKWAKINAAHNLASLKCLERILKDEHDSLNKRFGRDPYAIGIDEPEPEHFILSTDEFHEYLYERNWLEDKTHEVQELLNDVRARAVANGVKYIKKGDTTTINGMDCGTITIDEIDDALQSGG